MANGLYGGRFVEDGASFGGKQRIDATTESTCGVGERILGTACANMRRGCGLIGSKKHNAWCANGAHTSTAEGSHAADSAGNAHRKGWWHGCGYPKPRGMGT